jgi:Tfp pilus assembly protein PilF
MLLLSLLFASFLSPDDAPTTTTTATALVQQAQDAMQAQEWEQAEKLLLQAVAQDGATPTLYRMLGDVCVKRNKPSTARQYYKKAKALEKK